MGKIVAAWYRFWHSKKALFVALFVAISAILGVGVSKLRITQDIVNSIDGGKQFSEYTSLLNNKGLNQELIISIKSPDLSFDSLQQVAVDFQQGLNRAFPGLIDNLTHEAPDGEDVYDFFHLQLPYFADTNKIKKQLGDSEEIREKLKANHETLFTPEGFFFKKFLFKDPFQFVPPIMEAYGSSLSGGAITVINGSYALADSSVILRGAFSEQFLHAEDRLAKLSEIEDWLLHTSQQSWLTLEVDYFNSGRVALENAKQVKKDTLLTLIVSLSIILFLLFFYYRKITIPIFFLIPGAFGVLFSLGIIGWLRPDITGLSLGAGAVVIGIIMDYSFHFFTHLKHTGSVRETLLDVAHPLIIGCFTTVLAFGALVFANSVILNDFGLFASLSLVGTLFGVLLFLPVILPKKWLESFTKKALVSDPKPKRRIVLPKKWGLAITVVATIVAITGMSKVGFEGDLDKLNYYPEHIRLAEEKHTGFTAKEDKRLFVAVSDSTPESAMQKNELLTNLLTDQKSDSLLKNYLSISTYFLSEERKVVLFNNWEKFWAEREFALFEVLDQASEEFGYSDMAFNSFKQTITEKPENIELDSFDFTSDLYEKLVSIDSSQTSILTVITASRAQLEKTKAALQANEDFVLLDRADLTEKMVSSVEEDFNYILLVSSIIVFLVLLINFGRIELTLITFLPMILSWIWILGFAGWMDIKFNLINVVVTTFIFGLGDDFAIFISEGKLNKYRTGSDSMSSFRTGIVLSAITTIVGTGVLVLAAHPAIHSIGLISIVGLGAILFISLVVQPILFDFFISGRTEKKKAPLTLSGFLISLFAFTFFLSGCIIIGVTLLIFRIIPFGQKKLKYAMHHILRAFTWSQVYVMLNLRKEIINRENLNYDKPALIIANHQSFIDILVMIMLNPRVIIMTNSWAYNSPFFGAAVRYADYLPAAEGYENMLPRMRELIDEGYSIMIFPEGTRSKTEEIGRFHKGAFYLAEQLNLDIQPIVLHGFHFAMSKSDFLLKNGLITIKALPRISASDLSFGKTYAERTKNIGKYFKEEYKKLQLEKKDERYIQPALLYNYLYKSPIIEWYFRIKYRLERKNYDLYSRLLEDRQKIYDLGCGLGFLSYYLKIANPKREIIGVDYDKDKIELAANCYLRDEKMTFLSSPVENITPQNADAIFLMDVLHYLPENLQTHILETCAENLNENGILFIRDGISDDLNHHKNTERTEFFSTKLFGFNKTTSELNFFSSDFVKSFAQKHGLSFEMESHSKTTSNHLFILRKTS